MSECSAALEKELQSGLVPFKMAFQTLCSRHGVTPSEDNYVLFLESALIYHQNSQTAMFRYLSILSLETVFLTLLDAINQHSTQEDFCDAVQLTIWDMIENEHTDIPNTNTGNELPNNTEKEITENV